MTVYAHTRTHTKSTHKIFTHTHRYLDKLPPCSAGASVTGGIVSAVDVPELVLTADGSEPGSNGNGNGGMGWVPPLPTASSQASSSRFSVKQR